MKKNIYFVIKFFLAVLWATFVALLSVLNIYNLTTKVISFTHRDINAQLTSSVSVLNRELGYVFYLVVSQIILILLFTAWPKIILTIKGIPATSKLALISSFQDTKYIIKRFLEIPVKQKIKRLAPIIIVFVVIMAGKSVLSAINFPKAISIYPDQSAIEVPLDTTIEFTFDTPMNKNSVEKAFVVTPAIEGTFEWEADQKVIFIPKQKLAKNTLFTANFKGTLFSQNYIPLLNKPSMAFKTIGNPKVLVASPTIESLDNQSPVMVIFDRPMIPLTTIDEKNAIKAPFKIEPEISGEGRWLGTTAYQFIPSKPYNKSTKYTVTVFAGLKSQDDGVLEEPYVWTFTSVTPQISSSYPAANYAFMNPFGSLLITFNQKIDLESFKTHFTLSKLVYNPLQTPVALNGTAYYDPQTPNSIRFKPSAPLERGEAYKAVLSAGLIGSEGTEGMSNDYSWSFWVASFPSVTDTSPNNNNLAVEDTYGIGIGFSSPMDPAKVVDYIKLSPAPKQPPVITYEEYSQRVFISTPISRATKYTVTVLKGAPDQYGTPLQNNYVFSFQTASYKPNISILPGGSFFAVLNKNIPSRIVSTVTNANTVSYSLRKLNLDDFLYLYKLRYIYTFSNKVCGQVSECYNWQNYDYKKLTVVNEWQDSIDLEQNIPTSVIAKINKKDGGSLDPGMYFLNAQIPSGAHDNIVFLVTESNLTTKFSPNQIFVWAVNQTTGDVINNMNIKLIDYNNKEIAAGKTNKDGVWSQTSQLYDANGDGNNGPMDYLVVAEKDGDYTISTPEWSSGITGYEFGLGYYYYYGVNEDYKLYLALDNPIFRPKDIVHFKGILKKDSDGKFASVKPGELVTVTINDANGSQVANLNVPVNANGSFFSEFPLSESAALGMYNMTATYNKSSYSQSFQVEEYRKPEYAFNISTNKEDYVAGETANIVLNTSYYFGAPLSETSIKWTLKRNDYYFVWNKDSTYSFNNDDYYYDWWSPYGGLTSQEVTSGTGISDQAGNLKINIPLNISDYKMSQRYSVEAETQDQSNQIISGSKEFIIHKAQVYSGLKPASYVNKAGDETVVKVVTVNPNGTELKDKEVNIKFYKRTWETVREKNSENGIFYYTNKYKDKLVDEKDVTTGEDGYSDVTFTPEEGGVYRIVSTVKDSSGNKSQASTFIWVTGSGFESERVNNDKITLRTDKIDYFSGEEATAMASSPYSKTYKTLYTIERSNVIDYFITETGGDSNPLSFKVKDTYSPNVYVSAMISKPGSGLKDPPEIKVGYTKINVINKSNKLVVTAETDKSMYHPGDQMNLDLEVKDLFGNPVKAELLIGVVDQAVWDLSSIQFGKIYDTFYKERPLITQTSNNLTISMDRVNANTDLGSKGGSGGGGGGDFFDTSRKEFLNTAYWNPVVATDKNGKVSVVVKLPDNLTKWKINIYANTEAGGFGEISESTVVTKDLLIRPFLPKFLSVGDKAELGAIVMNRTDETKSGTIELKADGLILKDPAVKQVSVEPGKQVKVTWQTDHNTETDVRIGIAVKNKHDEVLDAVELTLPSVAYYTKETTAVAGEVKGEAKETIALPDTIVKDLGSLDISLTPNLGVSGFKSLTYLSTYPYECNEQLSSKLATYLNAYSVITNFNLTKLNGVSKETLANMINDAIQKLVYRQNMDGGWSWWSDFNQVSASNPFITTYVTNALKSGKNLGFIVDQQVITRSESFLRVYISGLNASIADTKCNQYNCEYKKQLYYLQPYIFNTFDSKIEFSGYIDNLWLSRYNLSIESRAYLAIVMNQIPGMQGNAQKLKTELISLVKKSNTLSHWEERNKKYNYFTLSTDTSTTAAVLNMLVSIDKYNPLISETVRYLVGTQRDGYWYNTRDTATVFQALANYLTVQSKFDYDQTYTTTLNGQKIDQGKVTKEDLTNVFNKSVPLSTLIMGSNDISFKKEGSGTLFYNMNLAYYLPTDQVKPVEQGFTILREYYDMQGKKLDISNTQEGSEFWTKLTVVTPELRRNVVIEDKLPAGLEAVNNSLKNSGMLNTERPTFTNYNVENNYYFGHREFRDNKTALFANYLPAGVYEVMYKLRATTPGTYHLPAAEVYEMYTPDVLGHTDGGWMKVSAN